MNHCLGRRVAAATLIALLAAVPASAQLETTLESLTGEYAEGYLQPFLPTVIVDSDDQVQRAVEPHAFECCLQ